LNPGPHGPESDDIPSNGADFCRFQFEISVPTASLVQIRVNLQPDYYTEHYMLLARQLDDERHAGVRCLSRESIWVTTFVQTASVAGWLPSDSCEE
jgi:hypothetical protein